MQGKAPGSAVSRWRRALLSALAGALIWSVWALFANRDDGLAAGLRAGATQAGLAFAIAFFMTGSVEFLLRFGRRPAIRMLYAVGGTFSVIIPATLAAHLAVATPEILRTLLPPWTVGLVFCTAYAWSVLQAGGYHSGSGENRHSGESHG